MTVYYDTRAIRSAAPADLPSFAEVDAAVRAGDWRELLDLRDKLRAVATFTADGALHATETLIRLEVALTRRAAVTLADSRGAPRSAAERPLAQRVDDARRALQGVGGDDAAQHRAAEVRARLRRTARVQ